MYSEYFIRDTNNCFWFSDPAPKHLLEFVINLRLRTIENQCFFHQFVNKVGEIFNEIENKNTCENHSFRHFSCPTEKYLHERIDDFIRNGNLFEKNDCVNWNEALTKYYKLFHC